MHKDQYGSIICCTFNQLKYSSPNRSKKEKKTSHTKEPTLRKREQQVRRMGQKQKRVREKEQQD